MQEYPSPLSPSPPDDLEIPSVVHELTGSGHENRIPEDIWKNWMEILMREDLATTYHQAHRALILLQKVGAVRNELNSLSRREGKLHRYRGKLVAMIRRQDSTSRVE